MCPSCCPHTHVVGAAIGGYTDTHIATRVMGYTSHLSPLDRSTVRICEMGGAGLQQLIEQISIGAMQLDHISYRTFLQSLFRSKLQA